MSGIWNEKTGLSMHYIMCALYCLLSIQICVLKTLGIAKNIYLLDISTTRIPTLRNLPRSSASYHQSSIAHPQLFNTTQAIQSDQQLRAVQSP